MLALVLALGGTGYAATQASGGVKASYEFHNLSLAAHGVGGFTVTCPSGTAPSGGGFSIYPAKDVSVLNSGPYNAASKQFAGGTNQAANSWAAAFLNNGAKSVAVSVYAICVPR
jgi:hypothetical protein